MSDLTDFLLARIAEDERGAEEIHAWSCAAVGSAMYEQCDCNQQRRALAECETKRRIVELADVVSGMDAQIEGEWGTRASVPWNEDQGVLLLRHLAAPYADHPDYREEWRP